MSEKKRYDWAKAMLAVISSKSNDLPELAQAANLNAKAGDLSDIDLSDLDLSGQNLRGWDLRNAKFKNTSLAGTELRNALVNPFELIEALDWKKANLDKSVISAAKHAAILILPVDELEFSTRTSNCLSLNDIIYIGDLVQKSETELLRTPNFGRKSLNEIKEVLARMGLHLGLEVQGWSR